MPEERGVRGGGKKNEKQLYINVYGDGQLSLLFYFFPFVFLLWINNSIWPEVAHYPIALYLERNL